MDGDDGVFLKQLNFPERFIHHHVIKKSASFSPTH